MILKDMTVMEVLQKYPATREAFLKHGMGCMECMAAMNETLEDGARMHGIDLEMLLKDLNELASQNISLAEQEG
ncbi:DUF1858 domain-containing protein [Calderihabitans maritimus]|uniref:DUF1858 domain-containing protein n=1 Tax=Calderihabitans maritimus TaxID=1246530 RepID=A0A1Z5HQ56_9FIRM|nr:DUF1858 domain-containing protein [Calderihabitans maritimus]GAW91410.1 hypothetical protein TherJR_2103 [Calderihabitans maritimus]